MVPNEVLVLASEVFLRDLVRHLVQPDRLVQVVLCLADYRLVVQRHCVLPALLLILGVPAQLLLRLLDCLLSYLQGLLASTQVDQYPSIVHVCQCFVRHRLVTLHYLQGLFNAIVSKLVLLQVLVGDRQVVQGNHPEKIYYDFFTSSPSSRGSRFMPRTNAESRVPNSLGSTASSNKSSNITADYYKSS